MKQKGTLAKNRKKALRIVVIAAVILTALILLRENVKTDEVSTPEGRAAFLQQFGWEIDLSSEDVRTVQLPNVLEGMLLRYNEIQLEQGYDLTRHLGENCRQYTYRITNYPDPEQTVLATLYVQGEHVIAGDIHSTALNGFLQGLSKETAQSLE